MDDTLSSPTLSPTNVTFCPNGTQWILSVFGDCAMNARDHASVYVGILSMLCYVLCTFPQYYEAYKRGEMHEGVSLWFLLLWVFMDTLNVAGTFLAEQLPLQKYFSINCILWDSLMLGIYCCFKLRNGRPQSYTSVPALCGFALLGSVATFSFLQESEPTVQNPMDVIPSRRLLSADGDEVYSIKMKIGYTLGIVVSGMWIVFRIPQIMTNFKRKSVEGLALGMFLLMMVENLCFGLSIVLKSPREGQTEAGKALHHLPWLLATVGSFFSDSVIMYQFIRYRPRAGSDEKLPLLRPTGSLCS